MYGSLQTSSIKLPYNSKSRGLTSGQRARDKLTTKQAPSSSISSYKHSVFFSRFIVQKWPNTLNFVNKFMDVRFQTST
jgi:hypothetical protein